MRYDRICRVWLTSVLMVVASSCAWAQAVTPLLNKVSYQFTVERWATTTTANVTVSLDAMLDKIGLANMNSYVLSNMQQLAKSDAWNITQYSRSQDKSGLEMLHIEAQARLPANDLSGLRDKAKKMSKPGETYTIAAIDFSPSTAELEHTHADLRANIYDTVKQEIARLNQVYPDQHYFLYSIDFAPQQPVAFARVMAAKIMPQAELAPPAPEMPSLPVNAKLVETAAVVIASVTPVAGH